MNDITFGSYIKEKRFEKRITLRKLAETLDIAPAYMSDIENGKRNISLDILERVADKLGIKLSEFFLEVETI